MLERNRHVRIADDLERMSVEVLGVMVRFTKSLK